MHDNIVLGTEANPETYSHWTFVGRRGGRGARQAKKNANIDVQGTAALWHGLGEKVLGTMEN